MKKILEQKRFHKVKNREKKRPRWDEQSVSRSVCNSLETEMETKLNDPTKKEHFCTTVPQGDTRYARLLAKICGETVTIAVLEKQPLICGREKTNFDDQNFLEIGDMALYARAVSRKHFAITYDSDVKNVFHRSIRSKWTYTE